MKTLPLAGLLSALSVAGAVQASEADRAAVAALDTAY